MIAVSSSNITVSNAIGKMYQHSVLSKAREKFGKEFICVKYLKLN